MPKIDLRQWDEDIQNFDTNKQQLLDQIKEELKSSPNDVNYLWRRSRATLSLAFSIRCNKHKTQFKRLVLDAMVYAMVAIQINGESFEAQTIYCIAITYLAPLVPIKWRIELSRQLKEHLDIAYSICSDCYKINHLFGHYYYEPVPDLTWLQKKMIKALGYGPIPEPSYEEALSALLTAHLWKPKLIRNHLLISKVLIAQHRYDIAFKWMERGLSLGFTTEDDVNCRKEIINLRQKYLHYLNEN